MVLADSGRIARVPPYLGAPLGPDPVSTTGLSPSVARLSRRLVYRVRVLNAVPQPRPSFLGRFGLFRFRSPLLAESIFFLLLEVLRCLPAVGFPIRTSPDQSLVSGSPKLIAATRVLLRLLSPRHPSCALSSLVTVSSRSRFLPGAKASSETKVQPGRSLAVVNRRGAPVTLLPSTSLSCAYAVVKDRKSTWWSRSGSNRRLPACKAGALPTELRPPVVGGPG